MPIDVFMMQLSPTMTEGRIARWLKKEGDAVESGEVIAEVETDKATMELEAPEDGVLAKILAPEGSTVPVGAPIAVLAEEGEEVPDDYQPSAQAPAAEASSASAQPEAPPASSAPATPQPVAASSAPRPAQAEAPAAEPARPRRIKATPLARRLAKLKGVDLARIRGSGPGGRIIAADVERAARRGIRLGAAQPAPVLQRPAPQGPLPYHEDEIERITPTMMRKTIARRLSESKQLVPHFYLTADVAIDRLLDLRAQLNEAAQGAFKLSVNDFVVKAAAMALMDVPEANASWTDEAILRHKHAHISVAVALEDGLITPVVRYAEQKGIVEISNEIKELAARAREGKLKPEEYTGGTFSVSNLGMFGVKQFAAIVNPPEGAILAVGAGEKRPVVDEDGKITVRTVMTLTLSCDHRVIDGALGARLLAAIKRRLELPASLLVEGTSHAD